MIKTMMEIPWDKTNMDAENPMVSCVENDLRSWWVFHMELFVELRQKLPQATSYVGFSENRAP